MRFLIAIEVDSDNNATVVAVTSPKGVEALDHIASKDNLTLHDRDCITAAIGGGHHFDKN